VLVRKASELRLPSSDGGWRFRSLQEEFPWWKAPRVRLSVLSFRGGARGAALQGVPSASEVHRADSFGNEAHTAGPSSYVDLPVVARHEPVTGGARVCQVGVNPLRRAVVVVGVDAVVKAKRPLT